MFSSRGIFAQTLLPKMDVCGNYASVRKVALSQTLGGLIGRELFVVNDSDTNVEMVSAFFDER
mgnify:CR=1 FL=1